MARPKKSAEERRDLQVNVRLSAIEHAKLASRAEIAATKQALKEAHRPEWKALYREQWKETRRFERADQTLAGRIGHALQAGRREGESRIGGFFRAMVSEERRLAPLQAAQERARAEMGKKCAPGDEGRCGHAQGRIPADLSGDLWGISNRTLAAPHSAAGRAGAAEDAVGRPA